MWLSTLEQSGIGQVLSKVVFNMAKNTVNNLILICNYIVAS